MTVTEWIAKVTKKKLSFKVVHFLASHFLPHDDVMLRVPGPGVAGDVANATPIFGIMY